MKSKEVFKILSPREHVRSRMGLYLGSSSKEKIERFVGGAWKIVEYVPAINKIVDEIIDNAIDNSIRHNFEVANKIDVSIEGNQITVTDNGTGIPQEMVVTPEGEKISRPVAAWTRVNAGTSFTEDRVSIGANGVGAACTNFVSSKFIGKTWQKGNLLEVVCTDGCNTIETRNGKKSGNGTQVTFTPDFSLFEIDSLQEVDTVALVEDRLISLQLAFPEIRFSFNGEKIQITDLKKYASLFVPQDASIIIEKSENVSFFFATSVDGFRTNSFVNGVNTRQGGSYVDFIVNGVVEEMTSMIKRKYKVEVSKSTIKNGLTFVLFVRNFTNPKFDSQTKERLTSTAGSVKSHYESAGCSEFKSLAKKIMASPDIIDPIVEAQIAKKNAADRRDAALEQKKLKKVKVAKHIPANSPNATLLVVEGDSACSSYLEVRDPSKTGAYPLRGVVMNTWDMKPSEVLKNKELSELIAILGLDINDPSSVSNMSYAKVAIMCDQDHDGAHIASLLVAFFYKFWPKVISQGRLSIARSPIMISSNGKKTKWFYTYEDATDFKQSNPTGYKHRYIKGLGSLTTEEYSKIVNDPKLDVIRVDKPELFDMMFGSDSSLRKDFMFQ
jgi:DNA gyrase/topoisomerase IV subunit B